MRHRLLVAVAAALVARAAGADGLADLRACLVRFPAHDPVRATVTVVVRSFPDPKGGKDAPKAEPATLTVEAAAGAGGITVTASPELLAALQEQRRARGKGGPAASSFSAALDQVTFDALDARLGAGRTLAARLDGATLVREASGSFGGAPARLVVLRPAPELDEGARKHVKISKEELRVWLDGGGCPLGSEAISEGKFRFLVLTAEFSMRLRTEFALYGDRLIAVRQESETSGSGMGEHSREITTVTVVPRPPEATVAASPGGRDERR